LGERLLCKQEVIGSIPFTSTKACPVLDTGAPPPELAPGATPGRDTGAPPGVRWRGVRERIFRPGAGPDGVGRGRGAD
jgi:hypothetical protein